MSLKFIILGLTLSGCCQFEPGRCPCNPKEVQMSTSILRSCPTLICIMLSTDSRAPILMLGMDRHQKLVSYCRAFAVRITAHNPLW